MSTTTKRRNRLKTTDVRPLQGLRGVSAMWRDRKCNRRLLWADGVLWSHARDSKHIRRVPDVATLAEAEQYAADNGMRPRAVETGWTLSRGQSYSRIYRGLSNERWADDRQTQFFQPQPLTMPAHRAFAPDDLEARIRHYAARAAAQLPLFDVLPEPAEILEIKPDYKQSVVLPSSTAVETGRGPCVGCGVIIERQGSIYCLPCSNMIAAGLDLRERRRELAAAGIRAGDNRHATYRLEREESQ